MLFSCCLLFCFFSIVFSVFPPITPNSNICRSSKREGSIIEKHGKLEFVPLIEETSVAFGWFTPCIKESGWDFIKLESNGKYKAEIQAKALGLLEAALSSKEIADFYTNIWDATFQNDEMPRKVRKFMEEQRKWMDEMAEYHCRGELGQIRLDNELVSKEYFWCNVKNLLARVDGVVEGFNLFKPSHVDRLDWANFQVINAGGDILDIMAKYNVTSKLLSPDNSVDRCSALITFLQDDNGKTDLGASHTTWFSYSSMNRVYKHITTYYGGEKVVLSQSSYPGSSSSTDDYYLNNHGLIITETSNTIYNMTLYDSLVPKSVPCWARSVVASRLARTCAEWAGYFEIEHAGSYPNQWMVVDTKLYESGKDLVSDTFWVIEELPGYYIARDQSAYLQKNKYWPSYNIPFYEEIFTVSGCAQKAENDPDYSWSENPRAKIFQRDAPTVISGEMPFQTLMRLNKFQTDPLSKDNADNAIAARDDLNQGGSAYGALDVKMTSVFTLRSHPFFTWIISSPTYDNQPPFEWTSAFNDSHVGQPNVWKFPFIVVDLASG